ncbi:MAG: hypothetical protein HY677_03470 [Chloroflexi bacterium]|nr:hypothetical protein [Chloroflexota bacterium]
MRRARRKHLLSFAAVLLLASAAIVIPRVLSAMKAKTNCPFYPNALMVRASEGVTTYSTNDAFGQVVEWYDGQHHRKSQMAVATAHGQGASAHGLGVETVAAYSMVISHAKETYLVTICRLRGAPQTFVMLLKS